MRLARVKNWKTFQHYRDRKPPWIKLHRDLLDDIDFITMPVASRAIAPLIWLLASEKQDGEICIDSKPLAIRLRLPEKEVVDGVNGLISNGFLIVASELLADRKRVATVETERERETEVEGEGEVETIPKGLVVEIPAESSTSSRPACPTAKIIALYHEVLPELPKCEKVTSGRAGAIRQRWTQDLPALEDWRNFFNYVRESKFLMGLVPGRDGQKPFRADIDFLTKESRYAKIAEGAYHR